MLKAFLGFTIVRTYFVFQIILRICISFFTLYLGKIEFSSFPSIFLTGLLSDTIFLCYAFPVLGLLSSIFHKIFGKNPRIQKAFAIFGYFLFLNILILDFVSEIGFWEEFETRFNFIAVDYLIYSQEIIGTLKADLPLNEIIAALLLLSSYFVFRTRKSLYFRVENFKAGKCLIYSALCFLLSIFSFYFYDSEKFNLGSDRYSIELGKNGPYEFFSAFYGNKLNYYKLYPTINETKALETVRNLIAPKGTKFLGKDIERIENPGAPRNKYNVIILVVESLSAEFMGKFGNKDNITPYLDSLADESLFFTNFYATGTRTVRGLEAVTLSIPPIPGASLVRTEGSQNSFNIASVFRKEGYSVDFLYGGYSYFDNLKGYFGSNGYRVIDRSDFKDDEIEFSNIWGICDGDVLSKGLKIFDEKYKAGKPFFSLIMTTSNHRPYTFPDGKIDLKSKSGRKAAVKYTDYAIGQFIEEARKKDWFNNTLFVIVADHCASSAGKTDLPIEKYKIPLIIYAPKLIKPKVVDSLACQIDIAPTVFSLLGFEYKSKFFGSDIIKNPPKRAFISTYQSLGYMKDGYLIVLKPKVRPKTYKLIKAEKEEVPNIDFLLEESISFYQSAYRLFSTGQTKDF